MTYARTMAAVICCIGITASVAQQGKVKDMAIRPTGDCHKQGNTQPGCHKPHAPVDSKRIMLATDNLPRKTSIKLA